MIAIQSKITFGQNIPYCCTLTSLVAQVVHRNFRAVPHSHVSSSCPLLIRFGWFSALAALGSTPFCQTVASPDWSKGREHFLPGSDVHCQSIEPAIAFLLHQLCSRRLTPSVVTTKFFVQAEVLYDETVSHFLLEEREGCEERNWT